jgi:hypothetical protein
MTETVEDLLDSFTTATRVHFQATSDGDYKAANKAAKRIHQTFLRLREHGSDAREALLQLALSSADAIAVMAAVYSMKYDSARALTVLKRFSKDSGILGLQAAQAVKRWKSGEWELE